MIKTLKTMSKQDKERYTVPRKVQDVIPVRRIWQDGIFLTGNKFSKTYQFSDINYLVASREDKESMFLIYSELLNSLDSGAVTKITINNRRTNKANFENSILMPIQRYSGCAHPSQKQTHPPRALCRHRRRGDFASGGCEDQTDPCLKTT